jgi:hypothetical protein
MVVFLGEQLYAQNPTVLKILSVTSYDNSDNTDNDSIYHAGQTIIINALAEDKKTVLNATIQITSAKVKYNSGLQILKSIGSGAYTYTWNTIGLLEANDYVAMIKIIDPSNLEVTDQSLRITIDNIPPTGGTLKINDGQAETDIRTVNLKLSAKDDPSEMFIDGDVVNDTNTFEWIPYSNQFIVNLTDTDGNKQINVKFRDAARNESAVTTASISLNRKAPTSTSIVIQDGAKYTITKDIILKLNAVNAEQMFIDGDIEDDATTFEFIPYKEQVSVKLSSGDGEKRIGVKFRNKLGIQSDRIQSIIILDTMSPVILSIISQDSIDSKDNDRIYHPGQSIVISMTAKSGEVDLSGKIRIRSTSVAYDSGEQKMDSIGQEFKYVWNTKSLQNANDYVVWVQLTDVVGLKTENSDLKITLNSSPPVPGQIIINNDAKTTESVSVGLKISAVDVNSVFISGDVVADTNTFQWIPYQTSFVVNLSGGDGQKNVSVKFRNAAGNESAITTASIILDRKSPYDFGLTISNTAEGAISGESDKFSTSKKVFIGLSAKNATEVFISGDVTTAFNTFRWVSYSPQMSVDLTEGDGIKAINAKFRNQLLIESDQIQSEIILDTAPPKILSTTVQNVADPTDIDGWYHSGESLQIIVNSVDINEVKAMIRVKSVSADYDSGNQLMVKQSLPITNTQNTQIFGFVWDTKDLNEGNDYFAVVTLTDLAGWSKTGDPLLIHIDNTPPANAKASINKGSKRTASETVTLEASADDAVEIFVFGDVRTNTNTFQWIPLQASMDAILSSGDGIKIVNVKFRDKARNETDPITLNIILGKTPPIIEKVDSWDTADLSNNDEKYHSGELVELALKAQSRNDTPKIETALLGTISITSADGKYKSGALKAREEDGGWYTYVWDTIKLAEGDYLVTWNLSDGVGHSVTDNSLHIIIDNTPPKNPSIIINDKSALTKSRIVNLNLQATGALWAFIDGDVLQDKGATFEWIPFTTNSLILSVRLTDGDGIKLVNVRFKDSAENATEIVTAQITLDTVGPNAISVKINNGDGYTASTDVKLAVLAEEAVTMYIDGDVVDGANVRKWIPYQKDPVDLKLTDGDGIKSINVEFQDMVGNSSKKITETIIFDTTSPKVKSVKSFNSADLVDNDGRYLDGTNVIVIADAGETLLSATIQLSSQKTGYDSGIQKMNDAGDGTYDYFWNTNFLQSATDYTAKIELKDKSGNSITDSSLIIVIFDKPIEQKVSINNGDKITTSQSVLVTFSADNASEINISGDVMDDINTFQWIKFTDSTRLNLTQGDGIKNVKVTFRDSQSSILGENIATIKLDQTPPKIISVKTLQEAYRAGNSVEIDIQAGGQEAGLNGTIQIRSFSTGYDSGIQKSTEKSDGQYVYLWDTTGIKEGDDYLVEAILSDDAGLTVNNNSLIIAIDNTPPSGGSFTINGGDQFTQKRSVKLKVVSADEASEMFIEGDVVADSNTFQWIPVKDELVVNLTVKDEEKRVAIRFRDAIGNEAKPIENNIILNELPPVINAIASWDESNASDTDNIYHAGQVIKIAIAFDNKEEITSKDIVGNQLQAWFKVTSQKTGYDSGPLMATLENSTIFSVVWKTNSVPESSDYIAEATLQDGFGQKTVDKSLIITIDNTLPVVSELSINESNSITDLQDVTLNVSTKDVKDVKEMFISGDVVESLNTFVWIPYTDTIKVTLSKDNGKKNITVKLKDSAENISVPVSASITLDRSVPSLISINIKDGAKYINSYTVALSLSAQNAREMFINGDVVQDENTSKWIPYETELIVRLTKEEGVKTIYAKFRNGVDNESGIVNTQILLDITSPGIAKIESFDSTDNTDNDFNYHSGQKIVLKATALNDESGLTGWVRILGVSNTNQIYDSGRQSMTDAGHGQYNFLWDTESIPEGISEGIYSCEVSLEDSATHLTSKKVEIAVNNQQPFNPTIAIDEKDSFAYIRTIEVSLSAEGSPSEVFIAGDVINEDTTYRWIPFSPDADGKMKVKLNLRGTDGKKKITSVFRTRFRSESSVAEASITLELKRPELAGSCRIIQTSIEPIQAYLTLQFDEPISTIDPKSFFVTLRDKSNPQNIIQISGVGSEPVLSNDLVIIEIHSEQLDQIKQWQPMTTVSSYIQAEIAENSVLDMADKGNLGNKQKPSDVYFAVPDSSMNVTVDPPSFSPNNDGIKDKVTISYSLARTSDVIIKIIDSQMETVKEWDVENQQDSIIYPVEWDGKKPDGTYPDGLYTVIVMSKVLEASGLAYGLERSLNIDTTQPKIVDFRPWEGASIPALLRASVNIIDTPNTIAMGSVYATIDDDAENKMQLAKSKTEGEYVVPTNSQFLLPTGRHSITFHAVDVAGNESDKTVNYIVVATTSTFLDLMNFPNPFPPGGTTTIRYSLPEQVRNGELAIYDAGGDILLLKELIGTELESGDHTLQWDGKDTFSRIMARGVYFCQLSITTDSGNKSKLAKIAIR